MLFLENHFSFQAAEEYQDGLAVRVAESDIAIDGIYSLIALLRQPGPRAAVVRPVIINGIEPARPHQRLRLGFIAPDGTMRQSAHPKLSHGQLTEFGPSVAFGSDENTAVQPIETAYFGKRLDTSLSNKEVRDLFATMRSLHQLETARTE
jgi:hypothetical protein